MRVNGESVDYDFTHSKELVDIEKYLVRANSSFVIPEPVLSQGDIPIMSLGDISVVTGLPKSRKTFFISALAAAFLLKDGYLGLKSSVEGGLLIIDTEQSASFAVNVLKRIYSILGWDFEQSYDSINMLTIRELSPKQRCEVLEKAVERYKPKLVIVDGFADLLRNTNEIDESVSRVNDLMRISTNSNCHICSVVHTNPSSDKMRGHTGSELQRKAETVFLVKKSESITTISPQFCRNKEFKDFSFLVDERGLPISAEYTPPKKEISKVMFEEIFEQYEQLSYSELGDIIMEKAKIKIDAANKRISKGLKEMIITKDIIGLYSLNIKPD